tara:strand:- start:1452 stop:1877 length:426 start_codon:yes stop_codon:yes gene_type:complete
MKYYIQCGNLKAIMQAEDGEQFEKIVKTFTNVLCRKVQKGILQDKNKPMRIELAVLTKVGEKGFEASEDDRFFLTCEILECSLSLVNAGRDEAGLDRDDSPVIFMLEKFLDNLQQGNSNLVNRMIRHLPLTVTKRLYKRTE